MARRKCTALFAVTLAFFLLSCERQTASVVVAGSTSVQPYAELLAEEYAVLYPENIVDVQGGGSSAGITAVESGTASIGMSSRDLKEQEKHLWFIEIARDGLAIIKNPDNPIENLTIEQVRGIYSSEISDWSEIGDFDGKIHIITREEGSGTRTAFEELVMGTQRIDPRAIVQDSNGAVRQLVAGDPRSIGFISLGLVDIGQNPVGAMKLDGVSATQENVLNGSYSLFRSFLFISKEEPTGFARDFISFVLSSKGRELLSDEGLIPAEQELE